MQFNRFNTKLLQEKPAKFTNELAQDHSMALPELNSLIRSLTKDNDKNSHY